MTEDILHIFCFRIYQSYHTPSSVGGSWMMTDGWSFASGHWRCPNTIWCCQKKNHESLTLHCPVLIRVVNKVVSLNRCPVTVLRNIYMRLCVMWVWVGVGYMQVIALVKFKVLPYWCNNQSEVIQLIIHISTLQSEIKKFLNH